MKSNSLVSTAIALLVIFIVNATPAKGDNPTRLVFLSASQLAEKIRSRQLTSAEVVAAYLEQIKRHNPALNAVVTLDAEGALSRAREADEALARGELWGPLHGVPVTIKDHYETAGMRTTCGDPVLADYIPKQDATAVSRLRGAGAIILGKTNMPRGGQDVQTDNPVFGVTNNPWDIERTPGGSSGGSAAAVAAGLTPLDLGSDGGGSIRIPSHFCGVFSLKPTEHLVSGAGTMPNLVGVDSFREFICFGPLARSIDDLKLCLSIIGGPDTRDVKVPRISLAEPAEVELKNLRIAWTDTFLHVAASRETRMALESFARSLTARGCHVERLTPPEFDIESAWLTYGEISGMQVGVHIPGPYRFLIHLLSKLSENTLPPVKKSFFAPMTVKKYMEALERRDMLIFTLETFLSHWDAWLCPVSTTVAFEHLAPDFHMGPIPVHIAPIHVGGQDLDYLFVAIAFTTVFNVTGSPVVVIPIGSTEEGLPIGMQVVGRRWHDMELLSVAEKLAKVAGPLQHPPGF